MPRIRSKWYLEASQRQLTRTFEYNARKGAIGGFTAMRYELSCTYCGKAIILASYAYAWATNMKALWRVQGDPYVA